MSSTIFGSKKRKRATNEKDDNSDVEDDFVDDILDHPIDTNSDTNSEDEGTKDDTEDDTIGDFQGETFDISDTVDLDSEELADVLSEKDSMVKKSIAKKTQPSVAASQKVLSEADWDM
jgi:hypothetical protein